MPTTILSSRPGRAGTSFRARRRWTVLVAVGALLVVQISTRLVKRAVLVDSISTLTRNADRAVRCRLLGPPLLARRSGARTGQKVLLLGVLEEGLIEAFSETVGRTGHVEALVLGMTHPSARRPGVSPPGDEGGLPFADASFDVVCLVCALGRDADRDVLLAEARRVLKPAGRVSISAVAIDHPYRPPSILRARCLAAGFEPIEEFGNALAYTTNLRKPIRK